ncbi:hypothetical protein [Melittangium boletus]|uniref:Uncharacterized protein n=1 Tax=Melittangium boletus DSM 14713 TaxID=1294270 RepID=A0A250IQ76_9BACT|nr:hypothetical protein [Melittangium boletus]ATB33894.1 hypothetical protein MEBOL_007395 [Melittangium boletus DSM 14713]
METYKQSVKEYARRTLWVHAVDSLTVHRRETRVLRESLIRRMWDYAFEDFLLKFKAVSTVDERILQSWCDFADATYGDRRPQDLRIAYLCGPEPENDLTILKELGVLTENVWAFEAKTEIYRSALERAKKAFPSLKIFPGSIDDFLELNSTPFDIIYLDFTAPLFSRAAKPYASLHAVFDRQALSELSALIVTTSEPDPSDEAIDFLTSYHYSQAWVEQGLFKEPLPEETTAEFGSGPILHPLDRDEFRWKVRDNFPEAYSAFVTQYPNVYASLVQPGMRVILNKSARKHLFAGDTAFAEQEKQLRDLSWMLSNSSETDEETDAAVATGFGGDFHMAREHYSLWHFLEEAQSQDTELTRAWMGEYLQPNPRINRLMGAKLAYQLRAAADGYPAVLSKQLLQSIRAIVATLPEKDGKQYFCNTPLPHLWLELALNQLGFPHHQNVERHLRFRYQAKTRPMIVDSFIFDRCRALYDWLPLVELQGEDFMHLERQMLARSCLNAIALQGYYINPRQYWAALLCCLGERRWSRTASLMRRRDIASEEL